MDSRMSAGQFTADSSGNVTLFGTGVNYLTIGANFAATGSQNFFTHPQNGATKLNITSQSLTDTDTLLVMSGNNIYSYNYPGGVGPHFQVQPAGGITRAFDYFNITNANGNLAMYNDLFSAPTWNVIVQTAAGNTTLTLPTSTNWSMSIYSGNAGTHNSTLFGSNTCLFDIDNVGGGNMTICTYDHAMIYMGGGQAGSTNPVLTNGFACRLFYGGVNGTNVYNLNTGLFPPGGGGGSASTFDSGTFGYNAGNGTNALPLSNNITAGWSNAVRTASNVVFGLIPSTNVLNANQIGWGQIPTNQLISSTAASTDGQGYAISNHLGVVTLTPIPPAGGGGSQTPWTQTINAGNFSLTNLAGISGAAGYNPTNIVLGIGTGMSTGAVWDTNGVNQSCISRMGGSIWLTNGSGNGSGSSPLFTAYFTPPFANGTAPIVIANWGAPCSSALGGYGIIPVITSNSVAFESGAGINGGNSWKINWIVQAPPGQ
jgi:hypothetical protein